jgi:PAS domain S-box-containing protein
MKSKIKNTKGSDLRRKAEKSLAKTRSYPKDEPTLKLVHELRVHQIELEMQNEELQQAREEIEVGLEKYSDLYDFAPVGYFTLTDDGTIKEANLTGASQLGIERSLVINHHFSLYLSKDSHSVFTDFLRKIFEDTTKKECEVKLSGNESNPRYIHIMGTAVKGEGNVWQCLIAVMDVTDRKHAEEEKKRIEIQLAQKQKMETIGTFAGGIAHDFNNILAAIIGYAELAIIDELKHEKLHKDLEGVLKASKRARDLVAQILSFSRHGEMNYKPIKLQATIKESLRMLRAIIPVTIEIRQNIRSSGMIMADPVQIHQIMMNLILNAVQAMGEMGGVLDLSLEDVAVDESSVIHGLDLNPGTYIMLTISDTGHGIEPEVLERIFEPYFTTKNKGGNSGLGLSVVQGIVKKNKGAIICKSRPGEGTTFVIYLPLVEFNKEKGKESHDEVTLSPGTERILFIDDEPDLAEMAKMALENLGYRVTSLTSSGKALEVFKENPESFDLVITDMTMPEMTGERLAQRLMEIRHDIPIILCSGYGEHISTEKVKDIGIQEYVMKPFTLADLAGTIRRVLDAS